MVSIIMVTLNTPRMTQECLKSVLQNTSLPHEIIVVANSRHPAILRALRQFPKIRILQNQRNVGYTKAANRGARASSGKYLCFLNSDTLVPSRWLERLLSVLQQPGVGAVAPLSKKHGYPYDWPPKFLPIREETVSLTDQAVERWNKNRTEEVKSLWGFCLLLTREVMWNVGFFDERFFFGCEDVDFSLRLQLHGYRLLRANHLFIHHQLGGSVSVKRHDQLIAKSLFLFLKKWQPFVGDPSLYWPKTLEEGTVPKIHWQTFYAAFDRHLER